MQTRAASFTDISVREILDRKKWQTRRIIKRGRGQDWLTPKVLNEVVKFEPRGEWWAMAVTAGRKFEMKVLPEIDPGHIGSVQCPYGIPGDQLWVRETWGIALDGMGWMNNGATLCFKADGDQLPLLKSKFDLPNTVGALRSLRSGWRSGRFMPRWASRLLLEVTDVKAERLQDITAADARAEGCRGADPRDEYRKRWESMHEPESWRASPWVWKVSFKVIEPSSATSSEPKSRRSSKRSSTGGTSTAWGR